MDVGAHVSTDDLSHGVYSQFSRNRAGFCSRLENNVFRPTDRVDHSRRTRKASVSRVGIWIDTFEATSHRELVVSLASDVVEFSNIVHISGLDVLDARQIAVDCHSNIVPDLGYHTAHVGFLVCLLVKLVAQFYCSAVTNCQGFEFDENDADHILGAVETGFTLVGVHETHSFS